MPISSKPLARPVGPLTTRHSKRERSEAFKSGRDAYQRGLTLEAFPAAYKPAMGDSILYDDWRHGWLVARTVEMVGK
ncbi:MAG: hypothetical protein HYV67_01715 [Candidatus Taylorbacteria bacterium]|nr:hypothetical protein [Candidatus Taylorbacteria bacterium]